MAVREQQAPSSLAASLAGLWGAVAEWGCDERTECTRKPHLGIEVGLKVHWLVEARGVTPTLYE